MLACDPDGGIGYQNRLPWTKIQGDLPRFKALTHLQNVVMGRNTWESLPKKPLPNRQNFVVTNNPDSITSATPLTLEQLFDMDAIKNDIWLIGGASLVNSCWERISEIHLTKTLTKYTCDTFINLLYIENNFTRQNVEVSSDHHYQIWKKS
jgi:dihydrofolate reductase